MRTVLGKAEQSKYNNKWAITFVNYRNCNHSGQEYNCSDMTSAPVFTTEDEAYEGGKRALETLETTGKYPNMCEVF